MHARKHEWPTRRADKPCTKTDDAAQIYQVSPDLSWWNWCLYMLAGFIGSLMYACDRHSQKEHVRMHFKRTSSEWYFLCLHVCIGSIYVYVYMCMCTSMYLQIVFVLSMFTPWAIVDSHPPCRGTHRLVTITRWHLQCVLSNYESNKVNKFRCLWSEFSYLSFPIPAS